MHKLSKDAQAFKNFQQSPMEAKNYCFTKFYPLNKISTQLTIRRYRTITNTSFLVKKSVISSFPHVRLTFDIQKDSNSNAENDFLLKDGV